ncbi:MAG: beta-N-acetylhexosaminidase [Akkermansiaceae bacterium]
MHGQLLLLGVKGLKLTPDEISIFKKIQPGGFVLFARNVASPEQLRELTDSLKEVCNIEPLITIDQEGGRVTRTRAIANEPPSAQQLRKAGDLKKVGGLIARHGMITADILRQLGVNMNLCPVLDISYDDNSDNAMQGRCYGTDAQEVICNAGIFNANLRRGKVLSCAKHFPSCGLADVDPHHELPFVTKTKEDLMQSDLLPYTALMPVLDSIMSCHAHFSAIDPDTPGLPGSFSKNLLTNLLRNQLGYEGLIMTDDLDMGAIMNTYGRGPDVQLSIEAGNDMAMICHNTDSAEIAVQAIKNVPNHILDDSLHRIEKLKKRIKPPTAFSRKLWDKYDQEVMQLRIDTLGEEAAKNQETQSGENYSPVQDY